MRVLLRKIWVAAKENGTTNHSRASQYLNDTKGIDEVHVVTSIHPIDASSRMLTGCRNRRVS